jgi:endo-1,4-beta-mannosidase
MIQNLKEVNYYPAAGGWTYMWLSYERAAIDRDFARLHALGANTVRLFIQPSVFGYPTVRPVMARLLSGTIALAAKHSLRVHLSLFDWWHQWSDIGGSREWLSSLLSPYRGDRRIAVVELHNEVDPENSQAIAWVKQLLPYLSTVLPGTPRTVSVANISPARFALFTEELRDSPPDFWDYHFYGPPRDAYMRLSRLKQIAAPRPLFIGETGYSTVRRPGNSRALEQAQADYYEVVFAAAKALGLPHPAPWTLNDFTRGAIPPSATGADEAQYDFGLYRVDGTPKPAAAVVSRAFSGG